MRRRNRVYNAQRLANPQGLENQLRVVADGSWKLQDFPQSNGSLLAFNFCVPSPQAGDSEESVRL